jgi:uncharacterized protein (TIGR02391 family)
MLTVAEETLQQLAEEHGKQVATHLYGQEINAETYAICKADLLLKGEGDAADNIVGGPEHSTLANDAFPSREFDFMLSNPPYGKSWKSDLERMGGKKGSSDPRFVIEHAGDPEYSLVTRSSDGQMLFLANMLSKMKHGTPLGSRIAEVHNGSSLFTGDAGQGESNIRRWIIENDWLEAIVALPLNMFYNTGIATYVWVLTNRKPEHRKGKVQLIDATPGTSPCARTSARRTASWPRPTSSASATPSSPSRRPSRARSSTTRPSATGRSPSSAPAHRGHRPQPRLQGRGDQEAPGGGRAQRGCPAGHQEDPQEGRRRPAARPVPGHHRRQARRGRVRARHRAARHRADPAPGARRHRRLPRARGPAPRPGRLVPARQRQDRLRDQLHPLLLQAPAHARVRTIRSKFQGRKLHAEVLKYCRSELMQDNYFHAVFEAAKGLAQRIRDLSGEQADGAALVDRVFSVDRPLLAINSLQTETERSEHKGFAALLKGCFAAIRNPLAHEPKILWQGEDDAADYLSLISLVHRKLDDAVRVRTP